MSAESFGNVVMRRWIVAESPRGRMTEAGLDAAAAAR
jgi:hypothetical protein